LHTDLARYNVQFNVRYHFPEQPGIKFLFILSFNEMVSEWVNIQQFIIFIFMSKGSIHTIGSCSSRVYFKIDKAKTPYLQPKFIGIMQKMMSSVFIDGEFFKLYTSLSFWFNYFYVLFYVDSNSCALSTIGWNSYVVSDFVFLSSWFMSWFWLMWIIEEFEGFVRVYFVNHRSKLFKPHYFWKLWKLEYRN